MKRVVVTGLGIISCIGNNVADLNRIEAIDDVAVEDDVDGEGIHTGNIEDDFHGGSFAQVFPLRRNIADLK